MDARPGSANKEQAVTSSSPTADKKNTTSPFALPPVVVTPVDLVGVNENPQPLVHVDPGGNVADEVGIAETTAVNGKQVAGETTEGLPQQLPLAIAATASRSARLYDMDLERMHDELYLGRYLTSQVFLEDIIRILRNAEPSTSSRRP
ncbi:hypothetical protein JOM56_012375 [Amanita muscaria]